MLSPETGSPADLFLAHHPDHAERIRSSVEKWSDLLIRPYADMQPHLLKAAINLFLQFAENTPEDTYIRDLPLSLALEYKGKAFLKFVSKIEPEELLEKFNIWYRDQLEGGKHPQRRGAIEDTAILHVAYWLGGFDEEHQSAVFIWDEVDKILQQAQEGASPFSDPVALNLMVSIQTSVIEQFLSDSYATDDLFGYTSQLSH